jgi:hypothetical protein
MTAETERDNLAANLHSTMDAKLWADEFHRLNSASDHATMLAWFANAIMTGYDHAKREAPSATAAPETPDAQLCKFYGVSTFQELVAAMEHHIAKLQAKLPQAPSLAPNRVREG